MTLVSLDDFAFDPEIIKIDERKLVIILSIAMSMVVVEIWSPPSQIGDYH